MSPFWDSKINSNGVGEMGVACCGNPKRALLTVDLNFIKIRLLELKNQALINETKI